MFRAILCTAALTIVALTAAHAEAGKHGGKHGKHHGHYHRKVYHAPVVKCYYQVCFYCDAWNYKKHEVFTSLHAAQAYAYQLQHNGYYATVSKTCSPYASGHIIYDQHHNTWLP